MGLAMTTIYAQMAAKLNGRQSRKIGNNTYMERIDAETIGVRYHSTLVVRATPGYVELDSGGWHTKTTWERMSDYGVRVAGGGSGVAVLLAGESWSCGGHPYFDGIRLSADGSRLVKDQPNMPAGIMAPVRTVSGWSGMTTREARAAQNRMFAALSAGDHETFYRERDALRGERWNA